MAGDKINPGYQKADVINWVTGIQPQRSAATNSNPHRYTYPPTNPPEVEPNRMYAQYDRELMGKDEPYVRSRADGLGYILDATDTSINAIGDLLNTINYRLTGQELLSKGVQRHGDFKDTPILFQADNNFNRISVLEAELRKILEAL